MVHNSVALQNFTGVAMLVGKLPVASRAAKVYGVHGQCKCVFDYLFLFCLSEPISVRLSQHFCQCMGVSGMPVYDKHVAHY